MKPFHLIDNPSKIDRLEIEKELKEYKVVVVQFSTPKYTDQMLAALDEICNKQEARFGVRFYGHYSKAFDANTVLKIPSVKNLSVDCHQETKNIHAIQQLSNLQSLTLGASHLADDDYLHSPAFENLHYLHVGETKTSKLNLAHLSKLKKLRILKLTGHKKNIESLASISSLEELTLHSITKQSVEFINKLSNLKSLTFLLGGRDNIHELESNNIEHLDITWVRGFNSLANIGNFKKLKTLALEDLKQLSTLQFDTTFPQLEELKIANCKTLSQLSGLKNLPALKSITIAGTNIDFQEFIKEPRPTSLKYFGFYTLKTKADEEIKQQLIALGYDCM